MILVVIWAWKWRYRAFEEQLKEFYAGDGTPVSILFHSKMIVDIAAGAISIRHRLYGPSYCTVSRASSTQPSSMLLIPSDWERPVS
jgi:3-oxoacyl-[acyl-carrier-protein] synthase II